MTWDLLAEGSKALAEFGLTWLCQSSALLAMGLLAGRMLRRSGPAVQSAVYRTALAAVFICPVASILLAKAGFDGVVLRLPVRSDAIEAGTDAGSAAGLERRFARPGRSTAPFRKPREAIRTGDAERRGHPAGHRVAGDLLRLSPRRRRPPSGTSRPAWLAADRGRPGHLGAGSLPMVLRLVAYLGRWSSPPGRGEPGRAGRGGTLPRTGRSDELRSRRPCSGRRSCTAPASTASGRRPSSSPTTPGSTSATRSSTSSPTSPAATSCGTC